MIVRFGLLSIVLATGLASAEDSPPAGTPAPEEQPRTSFYGELDVLEEYDESADRDARIETGIFTRYLEFKKQFQDRSGFHYVIEDGLIGQAAGGDVHGNNELNLIGLWQAVQRERSQGSLFFWWQHAATIGGLTTSDFQGGLGVLSPLNGGDTAPADTADRLQLLAWEQSFGDGRFRLMAGKLTTRVTFDMNRYAVSDREDYYTPMIVNNPVAFFTARGGIGVFGEWNPGRLAVRGMVRDADATDDYLDFDSLDTGNWEYLLELALSSDSERMGEGNYRLTYAHTDATTAGPTAGPSRWTLSTSFDQEFGDQFAGFLRYAYSDDTVRAFRQRAAAGFQLRSPLGYENDRIGFGAWWGDPSDLTLRDEYGVELFWRLQIATVFELTPDLQVVFDPAQDPGRSHRFVAGLRLRMVL